MRRSFSQVQLETVNISCLKRLRLSGTFNGFYKVMSLAYRTSLVPEDSGTLKMPFIKIENRRGPSIGPQGTPETISLDVED